MITLKNYISAWPLNVSDLPIISPKDGEIMDVLVVLQPQILHLSAIAAKLLQILISDTH